MTNGGTNYKSDMLFITSGRAYLPPSIVAASPHPPHNSVVLLDNFHGRQFNSLNDIKVHPTTGAIFFTDSSCVFSCRAAASRLTRVQVRMAEPLPPGAVVTEHGIPT